MKITDHPPGRVGIYPIVSFLSLFFCILSSFLLLLFYILSSFLIPLFYIPSSFLFLVFSCMFVLHFLTFLVSFPGVCVLLTTRRPTAHFS